MAAKAGLPGLSLLLLLLVVVLALCQQAHAYNCCPDTGAQICGRKAHAADLYCVTSGSAVNPRVSWCECVDNFYWSGKGCECLAVPQGAFLDPQGPTIVHTVIWAGSAAIVEEHTSAWLLFTGKVHWKDARDRCQGLQGDLTTLGKQIDIDRLVSWMIRLGVNEVWIGLTTKPGLGNLVSLDPADWFWMSTGATPAPKLDAWLRSSAGRMYPSKFYENCTSLVAASKAWQNNMCDPAKGAVQRAFVCEIPY